MNAALHLVCEGTVDELVTLDWRHAIEARGDDDHLKVRLRALRHAVHVTLVDHLEVRGVERLLELRFDVLLDDHSFAIWGFRLNPPMLARLSSMATPGVQLKRGE